MACGLTGVHQDIGGHFLGTGGDPTSVSMDQNMGNLWKSPSRNFWSWLFRAYMLCHMHLEKETSLVEHTWSLKLVHWQTTTKHLTLVWTPSSWASQNTPRASCHRPLFSQELMAALKEILCCKANPSPSQHFIPNNLHHLCIGTLVHLCHLTIFNLVKRCKQGWIEARVTSACNASASCKFFKSSNASSTLPPLRMR